MSISTVWTSFKSGFSSFVGVFTKVTSEVNTAVPLAAALVPAAYKPVLVAGIVLVEAVDAALQGAEQLLEGHLKVGVTQEFINAYNAAKAAYSAVKGTL